MTLDILGYAEVSATQKLLAWGNGMAEQLRLRRGAVPREWQTPKHREALILYWRPVPLEGLG